MQQIYALRPFEVHLGEVKRTNDGYRQKCAMFRVSWSEKKATEKILQLEPQEQRKARKAYDWLMNCAQNKYKHFVQLRQHQITIGKKFNLYNYAERSGIETALWPHLYPFDNWRETTLREILVDSVPRSVTGTNWLRRMLITLCFTIFGFGKLLVEPLPVQEKWIVLLIKH